MSTETWTVPKVIEEAAKLPGWHVDFARQVRRLRDTHEQCPVSALGNEITDAAKQVAEALGIPDMVWRLVARAADNYPSPDILPIRQQMLSAFHLQEEEG